MLRPRAVVPPALISRIERAVRTGSDESILTCYRQHRRSGLGHEKTIEGLARSRYSMPHPDAQVLVKHNPAYFIVADAEATLEAAQMAKSSGDRQAEARHARTSILLYGLGLEAFINLVYVYSGAKSSKEVSFMRARDKWLKASIECMLTQGVQNNGARVVYRPGDPIRTFDPSSSLFQLYVELKTIRDDLAHVKPHIAAVEARNIGSALRRDGRYSITRIPHDLSLWRACHAKAAARAFHRLVRALDRLMKGTIHHILDGPVMVEFVFMESLGRDGDA